MTLAGENFKKLTVVVSAWTLLLVFAAAVPRTTDFSWSMAWVEHWVIGSLTILLMATVVRAVWRYYQRHDFIFWPTLGLIVTNSMLIFLATLAIGLSDHPLIIAIQLFVAMINLGLALVVTVTAHLPAKSIGKVGLFNQGHKFFFRSIVLTGLGLLLVLITGAIVTGTRTGLACSDWPLCRGEIFPTNFTLDIAISLLHRFTVVGVGALVAAVILQTRRRYVEYPRLTRWSTILGLLFMAQAGLGGLYSLTAIPPLLINAVHLGLTAAIWGSLVVLATICFLTVETVMPLDEDEEARSTDLPVRQKAATFFKLTKPWILILLLITTIMAMVIAAEGLPPVALILYTFLGGALSAGGASVFNSYIDSDVDKLMSRTSRRATVTGLVTPQETLLFGLALSTLSFLTYAIFVNLLSAILSTIGILYYVFFYTLYLKRTTIHNIIIGGAAGAIPPLVGWTAVTNSLDLGALYLFAIIFFWTPPHTWALALLVKKDYARARIPMLPVVVGEKETTYQIFLYSILLITLTFLPFTFHMLSWVYLIVAVALGLPFIYLAWKLWRDFSKSTSKRLYKFSQTYLALLFLVMALDRSLF
jgi:protoheme IX farnesyltransferase